MEYDAINRELIRVNCQPGLQNRPELRLDAGAPAGRWSGIHTK